MKARIGAFVDSWLSAQRVAWALLILAVVSGIIGYASQHSGAFDLGEFLRDYYANISTEFASIAITVLIIDGLNQRRDRISQEVRERERLTRQLGSNVNEVARRAAEELRANGWLTDGTLQECDLRVANLEEAKLWDADLQGVNLQWAKLKKANLNGASLAGANLTQANLQAARMRGADARGATLFEARLYRVDFHDALLQQCTFEGAHLEGARFENADLRGAKFDGAILDSLTVLPDGAAWTPETDMNRFTNPTHPQFWQPIQSDAKVEETD
ncbi:MAG: pentapeptide repeat-containing protein [Anaerolineae bacterium]|nr:pentapeptide repeat-containing protein [Anaerolineae bacterium]